MSEMLKRAAAALWVRAALRELGPPVTEEMFYTTLPAVQREFEDDARAALAAIKYADGADEGDLIEVTNAEQIEAVSFCLAWDAMIDKATA